MDRIKQLLNGVNIVTLPLKSAKSATIAVAVKVGSRMKPMPVSTELRTFWST